VFVRNQYGDTMRSRSYGVGAERAVVVFKVPATKVGGGGGGGGTSASPSSRSTKPASDGSLRARLFSSSFVGECFYDDGSPGRGKGESTKPEQYEGVWRIVRADAENVVAHRVWPLPPALRRSERIQEDASACEPLTPPPVEVTFTKMYVAELLETCEPRRPPSRSSITGLPKNTKKYRQRKVKYDVRHFICNFLLMAVSPVAVPRNT